MTLSVREHALDSSRFDILQAAAMCVMARGYAARLNQRSGAQPRRLARTAQNAPKHQQHSTILVPSDTPGIAKLRAMKVYGDDDAPHGHMHLRFEAVCAPAENLIRYLFDAEKARGSEGCRAGAAIGNENLEDALKEITAGKGVDVASDPVGDEGFYALARCRHGGRPGLVLWPAERHPPRRPPRGQAGMVKGRLLTDIAAPPSGEGCPLSEGFANAPTPARRAD